MYVQLLLFFEWLPKTRILLGRFLQYWIKDLWFHGSFIMACLVICSSVLYPSSEHETALRALQQESSYSILAGDQNRVQNLSQLRNMLSSRKLPIHTIDKVVNVVRNSLSHNILSNSFVQISMRVDNNERVLDKLTIQAKDVVCEVLKQEEEYVAKFVVGDVKKRFMLTKTSSVKHLLGKGLFPIALHEQIKRAYASNHFLFDNKKKTYVVYQTPGELAKDYKLLLFGHGHGIEELKGAVLEQGQHAGKTYEHFVPMGDKIHYRLKEKSQKLIELLQLTHPVPGARISSRFGYRVKPRKSFHRGVDFASPIGTPVRVAFDGKVAMSQRLGAYGNVVILSHKDGWKTVYAHLSAMHVKVGDVLKAGAILGTVGNTGRSTGPHLHFELRKNNSPVDPLGYLGLGKNQVRRFMDTEKVVLKEAESVTKIKQELLADFN